MDKITIFLGVSILIVAIIVLVIILKRKKKAKKVSKLVANPNRNAPSPNGQAAQCATAGWNMYNAPCCPGLIPFQYGTGDNYCIGTDDPDSPPDPKNPVDHQPEYCEMACEQNDNETDPTCYAACMALKPSK